MTSNRSGSSRQVEISAINGQLKGRIMDIQHLVDRLEDLIDEGRHIWFSKFTLIDEERALEIIDQMRISVPEQIEKASRLINQRDRLLAQANEEATRVIQLAQERSTEMTERDAIVQTAQNRARNIIEQARHEAESIRADADTYVCTCQELEDQLMPICGCAAGSTTRQARGRPVKRKRFNKE
jgi:vacuolar-type H+-ATPase subunit H